MRNRGPAINSFDIGAPAHEQRLLEAYARRDLRISADHYSIFDPVNLFVQQTRDRMLLQMLRGAGIKSFAGLKILDVGCGVGAMLRAFNRWGAEPNNLFGIDLLQGRIDFARRMMPAGNFRQADAQNLPFQDEEFDLVSHFTLFDTILEQSVRIAVANEMVRVLRDSGTIIWYDFRVNNPRNRDVRRISRRELRALFPECEIQLRTTTLAPQKIRLLASRAWLVANALAKVPILCTHYLGLVRPIGRAAGKNKR